MNASRYRALHAIKALYAVREGLCWGLKVSDAGQVAEAMCARYVQPSCLMHMPLVLNVDTMVLSSFSGWTARQA